MWSKNITDLDEKGTFRSLNGAASENIFIGRATRAGYYCFYKVWRDMPYDAILDYNGNLYRIEIKGSTNDKFNVTRGSRAGKQIKKEPGISRTRILDRDDCDFVVCVDNENGDCYILPIDIVTVIERENLSKKTIAAYKEKWELFKFDNKRLSKTDTRDGLLRKSEYALKNKAKSLGVSVPSDPIKPTGTRRKIVDDKYKTVYKIWEKLCEY